MKYTLEWSSLQQCWHYNNGRQPEMKGWHIIAKNQSNEKLTLFTDLIDVVLSESSSSTHLEEDIRLWWKIFECGYEKKSYADHSAKLSFQQKRRN